MRTGVFSFNEYEACFSIWEKKKAQQTAKRNAGAFLLTLAGQRSAKRRQSAKPSASKQIKNPEPMARGSRV
jgi:hypothetical protein